MSYQFRIEEGQAGAGDIVSVEFDVMMNARDGFLTLEDGRTARRVTSPSSKSATAPVVGATPQIVSDALGFTDNQLAEMEQDRRANGFNGIEFRQDPMEPRFFQVVCSSERAKAEYMRHRGFTDQNSTNGSAAGFDANQLEGARRMVAERFGAAPPDSAALTGRPDSLVS